MRPDNRARSCGVKTEFNKRRGDLPQRLAGYVEQLDADRHVHPNAKQAAELVGWVLAKPSVETPVDIEELQDGLWFARDTELGEVGAARSEGRAPGVVLERAVRPELRLAGDREWARG